MRPPRPHAACACLLAIALTSCSKNSGPSPDPVPAPTPSSALPPAAANATARPPPSPSAPSSSPSPSASTSTDPELERRLAAFFAQYKDGSDFEFLRAACASPIERFVTAKNADIGKVIASSREFFKGKHGLKYRPDMKALHVDHPPEGTVARLPLTMAWGVAREDVWKPTGEAAPVDGGAFEGLSGDSFGYLMAGLVEHDVTVDVELAFDTTGRITRYVEGAPKRDRLRATGEENCGWTDDDPGITVTVLPKGTIVTDLGELYATLITIKGPEVIRHVRLASGGDAWVNDQRAWAVPNAAGGSSAKLVDCLALVP